MFTFSNNERAVLGAILAQSNLASGFQIGEYFRSQGQSMSIGSIYKALDSLDKRGYVNYELREGDEDRGKRPQRFFLVNGAGKLAISAELQGLNASLGMVNA